YAMVIYFVYIFFILLPSLARSILFPYTTLFRSRHPEECKEIPTQQAIDLELRHHMQRGNCYRKVLDDIVSDLKRRNDHDWSVACPYPRDGKRRRVRWHHNAKACGDVGAEHRELCSGVEHKRDGGTIHDRWDPNEIVADADRYGAPGEPCSWGRSAGDFCWRCDGLPRCGGKCKCDDFSNRPSPPI